MTGSHSRLGISDRESRTTGVIRDYDNGLEADASRFRWRKDHSQPNNSTCKLCHSEPEGPLHFIAKCPALSPVRSRLFSATPETIKPHLPDPKADPLQFTEVVLGLEWIKDTPTQTFIIDFLTQLAKKRPQLPDSPIGLASNN